ncbi:MAG: hypothetical protein JWN50_201 [Parcubacteria group bacterium]|nr:hypothetical protein [Parcubacteria group bacterium]
MAETDQERSLRICKEVAERMGKDLMVKEASSGPCIRLVTQYVACASCHATVVGVLAESHPLFHEFHKHREWLRHAVLRSLSLPLDTDWEEIDHLTGMLSLEKYESEEKFWEAYHLGEMTRLTEPDASRILRELCEIKFRS